MRDPLVQQALFGYRDGHDLLASSIELDGETLRLLRSATDVSIDGLHGRYLSTVIPLPKRRAHAFIRSWSAGADLRPGSVYAHVILVDVVTLGQLATFDGIRGAFSQPRSEDRLFDEYRRPLRIVEGIESKVNAYDLGLKIASGLYSSTETFRTVDPDLELSEAVLYGLLAQQWPKLRRSFAFRTRVRPTETVWPVDIEVAVRGDAPELAIEPWSMALARDLGDPDPTFRKFLWRYGAESKQGRGDMSALVDIFDEFEVGDFGQACRRIVEEYPRPADMRLLKRERFGRDESRDLGEEINALRAALEHVESFDLPALEIGARLLHVARLNSTAIEYVLGRLDLASLSHPVAVSLIEEISGHANSEVLASIALSSPELAVLIVGVRPELLGVQQVWSSANSDLLTDVFFTARRQDQREVLLRLAREGALEPLVAICSRQPSIWWELIAEVARMSREDQVVKSGVLGEVLSRIGTSAVAAPAVALSDSDLGVLLQASVLGNGLWRRVDASRWVALVSDPNKLNWPTHLQDRAVAVALVSGNSSLSADTRSRAWIATFGVLHERLKDPTFDEQAWSLLNTLLPTAPAWDRCLRLRRGVIAEMRRDRWSVASSNTLIRDSRGFESEMRAEIDRIFNPNRSWLEHLLARLSGLE
jgi:hypothetical protein